MSIRQGTLWNRIVDVMKAALEKGVLQPIPTDHTFVQDADIRFFVRVVAGLHKKDEERKEQEKKAVSGKSVNPFLPYEEDLFVSRVSDTHVALLNKFNVVEHHLLIVTTGYEDQDMLLNIKDFEALWACLAEFNGIGFYNGGEEAGASQRHKHLQMVPVPLAPEGPAVPLEPALEKAVFEGIFGTIPSFPFRHVLVRLDGPPVDLPIRTFELYADMLDRMGMEAPPKKGSLKQSGPYCFLMTRKWMLLVPRSREFFGPVSINSLGYAGALLVRNSEQLDMIKKEGPINVLRGVALSW